METARMMLVHSLIIGILLYLFMIFVFGQKQIVAETRSILLAAFVLIYMIMFGHGLPMSINKNLF
jgi:ACR3 family arsenite efflux pump ArsB